MGVTDATASPEARAFITAYAVPIVMLLLAIIGALGTSIVFFIRKILSQIDALISNIAKELASIRKEIEEFKKEFMRQVVKVENDHSDMVERHFELRTAAEVHQKDYDSSIERIDTALNTLKDNQSKIIAKVCESESRRKRRDGQ